MKICIGDTHMLVSKNAKICVTQMRNIKYALPPMQNPNTSQWNYSLIGSPTQNVRVGHVHLLFVLISFALGNQREPSLLWNMGFTENWKKIFPEEKVGALSAVSNSSVETDFYAPHVGRWLIIQKCFEKRSLNGRCL